MNGWMDRQTGRQTDIERQTQDKQAGTQTNAETIDGWMDMKMVIF